MVKVKAIKEYFDIDLNRIVKAGEEFKVTEARAKELAGNENNARQQLVEIIETPKKKTPANKSKKTEESK